MNDNVNISIRSEYIGQDGSPMEQTCTGRYYVRDDTHYILYEYRDDSSPHVTKSRIRICDDVVHVKRRGDTISDMTFDRGVGHISDYITGVGTMKLKVTSHTVDVDIKEDYIDIKLLYDLELNDSFISKCKMDINVTSR